MAKVRFDWSAGASPRRLVSHVATAAAQGKGDAMNEPGSDSPERMGPSLERRDRRQDGSLSDLEASDVTERRRAEEALLAAEQRRRLALDVAELGTWTWDLATGAGEIDARGAEIVGLRPGLVEDIASAQRASIHPDDIHRVEAEVARGIASRDIFTLEYRAILPDGSTRHVDSRAVVITDDAGRPLQLTGTNRDVTRERTLESAVRASEARLQAALDASDMATFVWHVEPARGEPDARMLSLLGLPPGTILTLPIVATVIHPEDRGRLGAAVRGAIEAGSSGTIREDIRVTTADGSTRWLAVSAQAVFEGDQERPVRVVGMASDITVRKATDEALRDSQERLIESDRRKDEFLAMLAHELRNPLAPIRTGLEVIRKAGDKPEAVARVRTMMERQVGHMVRLIDDLLDVSRITSGKIELQRQPTALADLVNGAVEANRAALDTAQLELTVGLPEHACLLDVDPTRLVQVISNLLHNAAKFTPAGGRVTLSAHCTPPQAGGTAGELVLTVSDNGRGIPQELLPHIFGLFTQGHPGSGSSQTGLGIGLALARRLIEMHGGRIEATSEGPGRGSAFTIHLPIISRSGPMQTEAGQRAAVPSARRVVIVDDNQDAAETLALLVEALGGETRVAHDGDGGLQAVVEFSPDVVLLDLGLPGMDGYETCRRIRTLPAGSAIHIVAVTGWGQERDKRRAREAGFDAHLTKPADPSVLERILTSGSVETD
jgi:PAS domain S-box-containing protein